MESSIFFLASQEGDVKKILEQLEENKELDVSSKDGYGMTALAYAARNGHVEVVRQLLSKGADKTEVLEQGYGSSNAEIARLLEDGPSESARNESHAAATETEPTQNIPMHMMNEGNFINGAVFSPQGYPMMPNFGAPLPGQQYYYDGMHPNGVPTTSNGRTAHHLGHSRNESSTGLPPPEVARSIPCRYFPNCRYGDKCMFAHPIMTMSSAPPGSAPISPSLSPPPMQPMFYQHMPAGYPYPAPYGAAPQFYSAMGPMRPTYGMVAPYNHSMSQPQPSSNSQVDSSANNDNEEATSQLEKPKRAEDANAAPLRNGQDKAGTTSSETALEVEVEVEERNATATPPQQDGAISHASIGEKEEKSEANGVEDVASSDLMQSKPAHRRQSFNSFLHHHAVPFQPNGLVPAVDMGLMNQIQPFVPRTGQKNRRAPAISGSGKRGNTEKPACVFFAGRGCRIGDECRFPHILPDGTDARPIQAQQRQMYSSAYGAANPSTGGTVNGVSEAPASVPTGPQREKKAPEDKPQLKNQQEILQTSQPMQGKSPSQSSANGSAAVVPSIPSKTSTGINPSTSRGPHHKNKQNNHQQNQHQQQQQQHQQQQLQPAQRVPTVNDFPALAVTSPNLSSQTALTPSSPSESAIATPSSSSAIPSGDIPSISTQTSVPLTNGKRANFSAILSAPAPAPKARAPLETAAVKEENGQKDEESVNTKVNGSQTKTNGTSKEAKPRSKEVKGPTVKVDSYKSAVISPNKAPPHDEDDFQIVHRSRTSNSNSNQAKAVAAA